MKNFIIQILLVVLISSVAVYIFSCAHNGDWAKRLNWKEFNFADLPGEKEYSDAGAIILLDEGTMQVFGSNQLPMSLFERHRIIKILNNRGIHYANITVPYTPQTGIEEIQARTISPIGKIKVLDKKNIYDVTLYPRFIFYSDQRAKIFTMPAVEDGSVIEFRYKLRINGRSLWPSWNFQDHVPTLKSRFSLSTPGEWDVNYKLYNIELEPFISKAPQGFKSSYRWEATDVAALKSEFGMPSLNECLARLEIAPIDITTWDDVTEWYHSLPEPQIKAGKEARELALSLIEGVDNNRDKLRAIYEWVRDEIRYIAVAIGIGGFQPHPAEEILINRYGDCKDMSTLLCSLAREVGIEAYEVLVSTWQNGDPDTSLPSPFQFNHAIAYCPSVEENGTWMDATEKGCPFGNLPWYDQELPVLVVGKEGKAEIITTPSLPADSNLAQIDWYVELKENGAATIKGKIVYKGAPATEMRELISFASNDAQRHWLETYLATRCSGANLDSFQISGLNPVYDPLIVSYSFHTNTFATVRTNELAFKPGQILAFELPDYFRSPDRNHPIQFYFGFRNELKLTLALPAKWMIDTPTSSDSIISAFGSASWTFLIKDKFLNVQIDILLNGVRVNNEQYQDFQYFLDRIEERNLWEVVLNKNSLNDFGNIDDMPKVK